MCQRTMILRTILVVAILHALVTTQHQRFAGFSPVLDNPRLPHESLAFTALNQVAENCCKKKWAEREGSLGPSLEFGYCVGEVRQTATVEGSVDTPALLGSASQTRRTS